MPGARCTRSLAWCENNTRVSHHRFTRPPGTPCAIVLTTYSALSLVTGLSCHHRPCNAARIITNLMPASGHQDHTASPYATGTFRLARLRVHRISPQRS
jgi:hypothetical protein